MKTWKQLAVAVMAVGVVAASLSYAAEKDAKKDGSVSPVLDHKMKSLAGKPVDLTQYKGKVLLIVNVASKCGLTPQYEGLQALQEKYKDKGLVVLGFPCNQFGGQEPGTEKEIATFCKDTYGVTFDMFEKIDVNGDKAHPLYKYLTSKEATKDPGKVGWNFEKFLIGRDGKVAQRFRSRVEPDSEALVKAIEAELVVNDTKAEKK